MSFHCRGSYRSTSYILPVVLFSLVYTIPKFLELRLVDEKEERCRQLLENTGTPCTNNTYSELSGRVMIVPTSLRENKVYVRIYLGWTNFIVQILIPFTILVILNFKTYRTIKESEKNLEQNFRIHFKAAKKNATEGNSFKEDDYLTQNADKLMAQILEDVNEKDTIRIVATKPLKERLKQRQLMRQNSNNIFKEVMESTDMLNSIDCTAMLPMNIDGSFDRDDSCIYPQNLTDDSLEMFYQEQEGTQELQIQSQGKGNKATLLRKREVILSRISIYIVFLFLLCHSIRNVPNAYEMLTTYEQPSQDTKRPPFPDIVNMLINLSHLMITVCCSSNFYIYFVKYGGKFFYRLRENSVFRRSRDGPEDHYNLAMSKRKELGREPRITSTGTSVLEIANHMS